MTPPRDPDQLIRTFLQEGSEQLHDQIYDAVRAEIDRKRQRVVIGPWRMPTLNKLVPIGLGTAAVVVALLVTIQLIRTPANSGVGGAPSATPSPSTATPSVAQPSASIGAGLPVGTRYQLIAEGGVRGSVTIPAAGWTGEGGILVKDDTADPPQGAGMIDLRRS